MAELIGEWRYLPDVREAFSRGELADQWLHRHPDIFDELDRAQVASQPRKHFPEWLAAVLLRESLGVLSLVEKYQFGKHTRKQEILKRLMNEEAYSILTAAERPCQGPDLLSYLPDFSDWFFVEVKGPNDRLRPAQREYFNHLEVKLRKPVRVVKLRETRVLEGGPSN